MFRLYLLAVTVLAVADIQPRDFAGLCSLGECPAGWRKVEEDCVMFAGWEERRAREVCRGHRSEGLVWSTTVWLCRVRRETQCQCGRHSNRTVKSGGVNMGYPWQGTVQEQNTKC